MARPLLDSSEKDLAAHVLTQATRRHDAIIAGGDPGLISLVGSSALLLAILYARDANTDAAEQCLTVARRLAAVLGADRNYYEPSSAPPTWPCTRWASRLNSATGGRPSTAPSMYATPSNCLPSGKPAT